MLIPKQPKSERTLKNLQLQEWSPRTQSEFCQAEGAGRYYANHQAGVWVDCARFRKPVIHNNYASLPHKKGLFRTSRLYAMIYLKGITPRHQGPHGHKGGNNESLS